MSDFYVIREGERLGPMAAGELRELGVRPYDLVRFGDDGSWLHLSTLIATDPGARLFLEEGVDPDEPGPEPWERRNLAEWTLPAMLLGANALWFLLAARANASAAIWITVLSLVGIEVVTVVGLLRQRPWAWYLATLLSGVSCLWMLAPLIAAPSGALALWSSINLIAVVLLWLRRPRGPALDWAREHRRLLLLFSADPKRETQPLSDGSDRSALWLALAGTILFFVVVLGGVYLYHWLRYPEYNFPISLVPRGADIWARLARMGVYGLMVVLAVGLARIRGPALVGLGIVVGQGWRRAAQIGVWTFLVLFLVLLGGRWTLRTVEAIEERIVAPADAGGAADTAVGQVRTAVRDVIDRSQRRTSLSWHQLWALLVALLIGPACEEIFFRGLIFGSLRRRWPFWAAALGSSLVFAGAHGLGAGWGVAAIVLWLEIGAGGLAAAYAYERTGTLAAPLLMHMLWNGIHTAAALLPGG